MSHVLGRSLAVSAVVLLLVFLSVSRAAEETKMVDQRASHVRHLNERMTMPKYETKAAWEKRAEWLREHIRVSCGLVPEPERTPLNPQVFGKVERDGYSIEKVYFESRPGFYVCGNLYRPLGKTGPFPAIARPHGHWPEGRFGESKDGSVRGHAITFARLGCVAFSWDMVGYNDSAKQLTHSIDTPRNELWGISIMALQTWNTLRVIDFLAGLPDVDPKRIGLSGESGGGTQTFMVMGIEPRVAVAAPVCMISGIMQGGCECENAPLLRIETNNIEIGALMAPRPEMLVSATGDWTRETPQVEYPAIRGIYELYGVPERVAHRQYNAGHNVNQDSREATYFWFRRHFLGVQGEEKFPEPPYTVDKKEDLLVWAGRELPPEAKKRDTLEAYVISECRRQQDALLPRKMDGLERFQQTLGAAYRHAILAELPKAEELEVHKLGTESRGENTLTHLLIGRKGRGDRIPAIYYCPKKPAAKPIPVLLIHPEGKGKLTDPVGSVPVGHLAALLESGLPVLAIDCYLTGESAPLRAVREAQKKGKNFFSAYNRTDLVERIQDILTSLAWLESQANGRPLALVGVGKAGAWCLMAAPFTPRRTEIVADLAQIGGDDDPRWTDDLFTPCILKAGGLLAAAALCPLRTLFLHNVSNAFDTAPIAAAYNASIVPGRAPIQRIERGEAAPAALAKWIIGD